MRVRRFDDPSEFLEQAMPVLVADEARNNLILGLSSTLRDQPGYYRAFRLWTVERDGEPLAAALQTPPLNLVLAAPLAADALAPLAEALAADDDVELPGVVAAIPEVDRFAELWEPLREVSRRKRRSQRLYRLERLTPVSGVDGRARRATADDADLIVTWVEAFVDEALHDISAPAVESRRTVEGRLAGHRDRGFLLWEVGGEPVSLAGWSGTTPNGIRIGPVYTPPEHRRHGYGSAVTAAATAEQLAAGRRFCFLYTDLANPTSNKIYMDIGYEPVCDSIDYAFERAS